MPNKYIKIKNYFRPIGITCLIVFSFIIFNQAKAVNDAIGVMVYTNKNHYSPSQWYQAEVENPGAPSLIQIDGYEAVVDGRTVYVAATNESGSTYYTNIYLISYNQNANSETMEIFNQLLDNWHFNTNIPDDVTKAQIIRDTKRLADLQAMAELINNYGAANNGVYPQLTAGTFVRGQSSSKWPSWNQTLGAALGATLPPDPTNAFTGCTAIPEPTTSGYDYPETCWNETNNDFSCLITSQMYFYNNYYTGNTNNYNITALTEIIDNGNLGFYSTLDTAHINLEGMITNAGSLVPMCEGGGLGAFCGNGTTECPIGSTSPACDIYVAGGTEQCEPGDTRNYCDIAFGSQNWNQELITGCNNDCTWYVPTGYTASQCGGYCGDNIRQGEYGEECDGYSNTTQFEPGYTCTPLPSNLHCNPGCNLYCFPSGTLIPTTTSCGNGQLEYPEQCDWLIYDEPIPQLSSIDNQYFCNNTSNATYKCTFSNNSNVPYGYCGDNTTTNQTIYGEQCDGSTTGWDCTLGGNISCPEAPDPNACLRICDVGCPYQGECGDDVWQNTGSCHEGCENDNSGKTPPNTDCNEPICVVEGCLSMYQACDGSYNDANGCEEYLGDNDNCLSCGNVCNYTGGNGIPFCSYLNNQGCVVDCNTDYHCSGDTYPYYNNFPYNSGYCPPDDICEENAVCGDGDVEDWEICDPGPPQNWGGWSCSNLTSPPQPTTPPPYVGGNLICNNTCLNFNEGGCCTTDSFTTTFTADNWFDLWINSATNHVIDLNTEYVPADWNPATQIWPGNPGVKFWSAPGVPSAPNAALWGNYVTFTSTLQIGTNVIAVSAKDTGSLYGLIGKFECGSGLGITTNTSGLWQCTGEQPKEETGNDWRTPTFTPGSNGEVWHAAQLVPTNTTWTTLWQGFIPSAEPIWAYCTANDQCISNNCNTANNVCGTSGNNMVFCRYIANW